MFDRVLNATPFFSTSQSLREGFYTKGIVCLIFALIDNIFFFNYPTIQWRQNDVKGGKKRYATDLVSICDIALTQKFYVSEKSN